MEQKKNCSNPHCHHKIKIYKRSGNQSGLRDYCSKECYWFFPPKMISVIKEYPSLPQNRVGIRKAIMLEYKEGHSRLDTAYRLQITWYTLARWEQKIFGRMLKKYVR